MAERTRGLFSATGLWRIGLAGLAGGALVLGAATLAAGLPYTGYVDEHFITEYAARQVAAGTWDPGWYWYPSLVMSLTAAAGGLVGVFTATDLAARAQETVASPYLGVQQPTELLVGGRLVVLACTVATVVVTGLLGRRLGGRRVGLAAAGFVAVLPAFVRRSSVVVTDIPATAAATTCLLLTTRMTAAGPVVLPAVLAGTAAGLATTSKYTAGAVLLVPLVVAATLPQRIRRIASVLGGWAVTAVVTMPALVLHPGAVVDDMRAQSRTYDRFAPSDPYLSGLAGRLEVGPLLLVLAVVGVVVLARRRRTGALIAGIAAWGLLTAVVLLPVAYQPPRNVLPFVPFAGVAAAVTIDVAARWLADRVTSRVPRLSTRAATAALVAVGALAVVALPARSSLEHVRDGRPRDDTREQVVDRLAAAAEPGDDVLVAAELMILPSELDRLPDGVTVEVASQGDISGPAQHDYVLVGRLGHAPGAWRLAREGRPLLFEAGRRHTSCAPEARPLARDDWLCPSAQAPRAYVDNDVYVALYGPRRSGS